VRVVNSSNRPVSNLNQAHFEVYEDNVLQPITSFTTAEVPIINALIIDNSRSLRSQLGKIIEAGKIIVSANRPNDESTIVRFVSKDKIEVVQDFTSNKSSLNDALDNLFVEGGQTAIIDAVYQTAKKVEQYQNSRKKEDVKLRALILVSDGDDRGSSYKEQQLFELLRELDVQIYAVGFVNDLSKEPDPSGMSRQEKAKTFLTRLAQETGGKVYFPNSMDELPKIAFDISGELRTQYLISYTPTNPNRDGTFRKIKVMIGEGPNKEKRIAITRTGRTSAPK
jgi:Ca-activated chloride channel family protein